ncbi:MAG: glycosyltransferase family 4 protein [Bacteroidota bacterium]
MNLPKKIAYITVSDPRDKHAWSGTNHYIWKALEKRFGQVDLLGPDEPVFITFLCKVVHGISLYVFKKRFDYRNSTLYAKACGRLFGKKLKDKHYDLIVSPAGIAYIAYLKTDVPIVFVGDRIIANSLNYHTIITNLWKWSEKQSLKTESLALHKTALNILSSHWAADYAIEHYHLNRQTTLVLPFGANMDVTPDAQYVFNNRKKEAICKLLLVGTYWKNKGVDIAINALHLLLQKNIKAHLTIVGCEPETPVNDANMTIIPFLNKNSKEGLKQLEQLFLSHSFFILPTRFDCTPIVFCEASMYGLPVLSANTGGVAGHVKEGVNGFLVDYTDKGEGYASIIEEIWKDDNRYLKLQMTARELFDKELNWDSWVNHLAVELTQIH